MSTRSSKPIRVLLVEDQEMVLSALATLLDLEHDISVVGQARSGQEALDALDEAKPDVVITDIEMPGMTGIDLAARLKEAGIRVLMLTTFARPGFLRRAIDAGASGYLLKARPARELAKAVRRVHQGMRAIDPELAMDAWATNDPLSEREREVLRLAGEGASTATIAARLHLSPGTVRNYLSEAMEKLNASNRTEAAQLARSNGWL
jgi:two-component system response regulator DesR